MSSIREITVYDLKKKIDNKDKFLLIDVRENQELAISKLTEALHIPMANIPHNLDKINSNQMVIVMCKSGGRSAQVCQYLNNEGYSNVYNLNGGIISWALEIDSNMAVY